MEFLILMLFCWTLWKFINQVSFNKSVGSTEKFVQLWKFTLSRWGPHFSLTGSQPALVEDMNTAVLPNVMVVTASQKRGDCAFAGYLILNSNLLLCCYSTGPESVQTYEELNHKACTFAACILKSLKIRDIAFCLDHLPTFHKLNSCYNDASSSCNLEDVVS